MRAIESSELMVENMAPGPRYRDSDSMSLQGPESLHFKESLVRHVDAGVSQLRTDETA